jgi:predicted  nucleic acid-binding Zn-ribbon protein
VKKKELLEALNEKDQKIQALEESHCSTKIEVEKLKEENITNTGKIDSMLEQKENSEEKLKKIRHRMVAKTFLIDPNNENLDTLQTLEFENLFLKYVQGMIDSFEVRH